MKKIALIALLAAVGTARLRTAMSRRKSTHRSLGLKPQQNRSVGTVSTATTNYSCPEGERTGLRLGTVNLVLISIDLVDHCTPRGAVTWAKMVRTSKETSKTIQETA
jgi:hypothetical protein